MAALIIDHPNNNVKPNKKIQHHQQQQQQQQQPKYQYPHHHHHHHHHQQQQQQQQHVAITVEEPDQEEEDDLIRSVFLVEVQQESHHHVANHNSTISVREKTAEANNDVLTTNHSDRADDDDDNDDDISQRFHHHHHQQQQQNIVDADAAHVRTKPTKTANKNAATQTVTTTTNNNNNNSTGNHVSATRRHNNNNHNHNNHADEDVLHRAVRDAGQWAFGTKLVEVWVLSDDKTKLVRPQGGWWLDPTFYDMMDSSLAPATHEESSTSPINRIMHQLFDPTCPFYEDPIPVPPGVGLPGVLWSDVEHAASSFSSRCHPNILSAATTNIISSVLDRSRNKGLDRSRNRGSGGAGAGGSTSASSSQHHGPAMSMVDHSRHKGAPSSSINNNTNTASLLLDRSRHRGFLAAAAAAGAAPVANEDMAVMNTPSDATRHGSSSSPSPSPTLLPPPTMMTMPEPQRLSLAAPQHQCHNDNTFQQQQQQQHQQQQQQQQQHYHHHPHQQHHHRPVAYRDLESLAIDPDQPYHRRVQLLLQCGLSAAAAVAFDIDGHQGIVIFMTNGKQQQQMQQQQMQQQQMQQQQHQVSAMAHHRHDHSDASAWRKKFQSPVNEAYWRSATDMIGAVYAMRKPRRAMIEQRQEEIDKVLRRVRAKLLCLRFMGIDLSNLNQAIPAAAAAAPTTSSTPTTFQAPIIKSSQNQYVHDGDEDNNEDSQDEESLLPSKCCFISFMCSSCCCCCCCCCCSSRNKSSLKDVIGMEKVTSLYHKGRGGNLPPPPPFTWEQTMWTFVGVFMTLLMLTRLNVHLQQYYGNDFQIVLGPFGALMTLLYGLTAAPASQPRNVVMGQAVSLIVAMAIAYSEDYLPLYVRQGLATAIAVAAMVKLGITHPPAGASALLFCSGDYGWMNVIFMLLGNIMAVVAATLINNMSDKRQYPIYWGLRPILNLFEATAMPHTTTSAAVDVAAEKTKP